MQKIWYILIIVFSILGCKQDKVKYNLSIEREKLKNIIIDIYLAGSASSLDSMQNKDSLKQLYLTEICMIHKVNPDKLKKTLAELSDNFDLNAEIQKEVLDSISKLNFIMPSNLPTN
jgi:hypothetical protein